MSTPARIGRFRAYLQFVAAVLYFFMARSLAWHGAQGLAGDVWAPLVEQGMLAFLLVLGYAGFGFWFNGQLEPMKTQGLPLRTGWSREAGMGLAVGWGLAVVCVLPMALAGGIAISLDLHGSALGWLVADAIFFAFMALAEEIAFRGYAFQRFADAVGPLGASIGFTAYYAIVQAMAPGSNHASVAVSIVLTLVLSMAYLRTRALWVGWGINFGWKASRALLFGLAVSGVNSHSPVVQGDPMGRFWLTGGGYGLDGSWVAFVALLVALPVVYRITRELDFVHNAPVLLPGGIPVDLDAAAKRQHEAAQGPVVAAAPALIQILPSHAPQARAIGPVPVADDKGAGTE